MEKGHPSGSPAGSMDKHRRPSAHSCASIVGEKNRTVRDALLQGKWISNIAHNLNTDLLHELTNKGTKASHSLAILTLWHIWKQRNAVVFREDRKTAGQVLTGIRR
jgi:hypothetical protein